MKTEILLGLEIAVFLLNPFLQGEAKSISIVKTAQPPRIDGKLTDACWKKPPAISPFIVTLPVNKAGSLPEEKTELFLLYDDSHLYIGVRCEDDVKGLVTRACPERDAGWGDDCIEIFLDPNQTKISYYQIVINSKGVILDSYCRRPRDGDKSWDSNCEGRTYLGKDYWSLEVKIPLAELGLSLQTTDSWGFNITRWQPRKEVNQSLVPLPGGSNHQPDKFGLLSGLKLDYDGYCYQISNLDFGNLSFGDNLLSFNLKNKSSLPRKVITQVECFPFTTGSPSCQSLSFSLKPDEEKKVSLAYRIETRGEKGKLLLKIIEPGTKKARLLRTRYFTSPLSLLELIMGQTDYYLSEEEASLRVKLNLGKQSLKNYFLLLTVSKDNKVLTRKKITHLSREISIPFAIAEFKPGKYLLSVGLEDKKGKILGTKEIFFNRTKGPFDE